MNARAVLALPFVAAIKAYQLTLSPFLGGHCRFYPSCSQYAIEAYREHGPIGGSWLTARRLARCHPFGGTGLDPVPPCKNCTPGDSGQKRLGKSCK